ncbi:hypothetical protein FB107DRAFT_249776 [Schizophyllum commune]
MSAFIPSSPQEWSAWARSAVMTKIAATKSFEQTPVNTFVHDVFVDLAPVDLTRSDFTSVYTDILALSSKAIMQLLLPKLALVRLYARVITSDQPTTLELCPSSHDAAQVVLWATYLDQPVSVALEGQQPQLLNLGPNSDHVGVSIWAVMELCRDGSLRAPGLFGPVDSARVIYNVWCKWSGDARVPII